MNSIRYKELWAHREDCFKKTRELLDEMEEESNRKLLRSDYVKQMFENMRSAVEATAVLQEYLVYGDSDA